MSKTIESLGIGLVRLLCYSYGGFLLAVCAASFSAPQTKTIIDALHPSVAVPAIIVLGAAIYVLNRTVIMPIHHVVLSVLFRVAERGQGGAEHAEFSPNPVRYLGEVLGVPFRRRTIAYNILRRSNFFPDREALNVAHAENSLLVMTGVGLLVAAALALSQAKSFGLIVSLLLLSLVFLAASFRAEWVQQSVECSLIKDRPVEALRILARMGMLRSEEVAATVALTDLKDDEHLETLHDDLAGEQKLPDADGT